MLLARGGSTVVEPGMGEIEKVGDLESQNLGIKNHLRNIGPVKISLFRMKKFEINKLI
jgi:hypothetical protein